MQEPLEEQYFQWLYRKVASVRMKNPARTYWSLLRRLHMKEFVMLIPNDDNRVEDGRDLRSEFLAETGVEGDLDWHNMGCSMLEMLVALTRRLVFEAESDFDADDWFWLILQNIELNEYTDLYVKNRFTEELIDKIIDDVIWRRYDESGKGGLFPLNEPHGDQRRVELWYQMSSYLLERA
jgi:hypothetical protein